MSGLNFIQVAQNFVSKNLNFKPKNHQLTNYITTFLKNQYNIWITWAILGSTVTSSTQLEKGIITILILDAFFISMLSFFLWSSSIAGLSPFLAWFAVLIIIFFFNAWLVVISNFLSCIVLSGGQLLPLSDG